MKKFRKNIKNAEKYIGYGTKYLERGHLAPRADFIMPYEQYGTFYFMNTVPQFKDINNGNWARIENLVRKFAATLKDDLVVYTSYSHNTPATFTDQNISVLLDEKYKHLIIPERLYKVIYYPRTKSGIVFVVYNNPYKKKMDPIPQHCQGVCKRANLEEYEELKHPAKGYVMCCKINYIKENAIDLYREIAHNKNSFDTILKMPANS